MILHSKSDIYRVSRNSGRRNPFGYSLMNNGNVYRMHRFLQQCSCVKHKPDLLQRIQFQSLLQYENHATVETFPRKVFVGMLIKQCHVEEQFQNTLKLNKMYCNIIYPFKCLLALLYCTEIIVYDLIS
jgi:hypothetical protein